MEISRRPPSVAGSIRSEESATILWIPDSDYITQAQSQNFNPIRSPLSQWGSLLSSRSSLDGTHEGCPLKKDPLFSKSIVSSWFTRASHSLRNILMCLHWVSQISPVTDQVGACADTNTIQPTPMFLEWRKICIWLVIDWTTSTQLVREIVQSNKFKVFFWLFGFAWLDEVGYDVFQVPSNILITKYPAHYYLPAIEIFWGLFTLVTAFVTTYEQLVVMRFFVGLSSTACYIGCLTVISS